VRSGFARHLIEMIQAVYVSNQPRLNPIATRARRNKNRRSRFGRHFCLLFFAFSLSSPSAAADNARTSRTASMSDGTTEQSANPTVPTAPKRRWFRFSLRTLLLFVLLIGSAMGLWWKWEPWVRLVGEINPLFIHPAAFSVDCKNLYFGEYLDGQFESRRCEIGSGRIVNESGTRIVRADGLPPTTTETHDSIIAATFVGADGTIIARSQPEDLINVGPIMARHSSLHPGLWEDGLRSPDGRFFYCNGPDGGLFCRRRPEWW
jgi:hypothetical protein